VGHLFKEASESFPQLKVSLAEDWKEALVILKESAEQGSTILVKGSNSMNLGKLVQELKKEGI